MTISPHEQARAYARAQAETYRAQLHDLIRIPSISADSKYNDSVIRAAEFIADDLRRIGAHNVEIMPTGGHPLIYGEWMGAGADAPTVLIYGHYDVQPAYNNEGKPDKGWLSDPFDPTEKDGFLYARGSSDDKGQMFIHLKAFESYMAAGVQPPVNLKFFIEGEEEVGSKNLTRFIETHADLLRADVCVISDSGMVDPAQPAIINSVRGMTYMEVHVVGPNKDLHSGGYGGIVHNPALALIQILSKMHDADNHITVPGFYDEVVALSPEEREELKKTDFIEADLKSEFALTELWGEAGYTLRERIGARPTFEINGLYSGYIGEGAKTVLPSAAMAKISCRLVANQTSEGIYELVKAYVAQLTPPGVTSETVLLNTGEPALIDFNTPMMSAAVRAYEAGWGKAPIFVREGGSIPVVADMQRILGLPVLMMGYGLNSDGAHGPNERFSIEMFHKGIDTAIVFLNEAAKVGRAG